MFRAHVATHHPRRHPRGYCHRSRSEHGEGRHWPDRTDPDEPCRQCAGRHADRRRVDGRAGKYVSGRGVRSPISALESGSLCDADRERYRRWNERRDAAASVRSIFHDQGSRTGNGFGIVNGVRDRETAWRQHFRLLGSREGQRLQALLPADCRARRGEGSSPGGARGIQCGWKGNHPRRRGQYDGARHGV